MDAAIMTSPLGAGHFEASNLVFWTPVPTAGWSAKLSANARLIS